MGMFFVIIVLIVILFGFRITQYMVASAYVEDALAASNLASAVIDLEEYGKGGQIRIEDPEEAYLVYREALCHNLQLDEFLNTTNRDMLADKVIIEAYHVYNVHDQLVEISIMDGTGRVKETQTGTKGQVYTPDGVCVENTTIYSKVVFAVKGIGEQNIQAQKEKSVDIVRYESE